jgi:hypothetical protein
MPSRSFPASLLWGGETVQHPTTLHFNGTMRVTAYDVNHGLRMERFPESHFKLWFGIFFSVGLIVVGVAVFWRLALENYAGQGSLNWLDIVLLVIGFFFATFGSIVALPLAARFLPRSLITTHQPASLSLHGFRTRTWKPGEADSLLLHGKQYLRRTSPDKPTPWYVFSLILISGKGRQTLLVQTKPQPDYDVAHEDISPIAAYFANVLNAAVETRCNWDAPNSITGGK